MDDSTVEVTPKRWFKFFMYVSAFICIVLGTAVCYLMLTSPADLAKLQNGHFVTLFVFISSAFLIILGFFIGPYFYRKKITLDQEKVAESGLISRELFYHEIEKITISMGQLIISGPEWFQTISTGDLNNNFDRAVEMLASKIEDFEEIEFKGSEKNIKNYFSAEV